MTLKYGSALRTLVVIVVLVAFTRLHIALSYAQKYRHVIPVRQLTPNKLSPSCHLSTQHPISELDLTNIRVSDKVMSREN